MPFMSWTSSSIILFCSIVWFVAASKTPEKDVKFWTKVNLKKEDVPAGEHDLGLDYVNDDAAEIVAEHSVEVDGVKGHSL